MARVNVKHWINGLQQEGFVDVRVCPLPPAEDLPEHTHDQHTVHVILSGELTITDKRGANTYRPGERVEFPAGTIHRARGSPDGGEMIIGVKERSGMRKIVPHLWFDKEAREAVEFYTSNFPDSKITNITTLHNTPSGDADIVSFVLAGQSFMAISAGPVFQFNPSASFIANFDPSRDKNARESINVLWEKLSRGGRTLMPLQQYPFSERYGWIQDRYGLSWQLILSNPQGEERPFVVPSLMFVGAVCGKAEEAINFYLSVFKHSKRGTIARFGKGQEPDKEGTIMFADFMIESQWFAAMDSAREHNFAFNEAISFMVYCNTQEEIDHYWDKLSAVPEAEQCGWLKDKYGLSWQVVPTAMDEMMQRGSKEQIARVTEAFLKMKKFDLAALKEAYKG